MISPLVSANHLCDLKPPQQDTQWLVRQCPECATKVNNRNKDKSSSLKTVKLTLLSVSRLTDRPEAVVRRDDTPWLTISRFTLNIGVS